MKTAQSYIRSGAFSDKDAQKLDDKLDEILAYYDKPNVSIVELIYGALFALHGMVKKTESVVLDWEEWGRTLRKEYQIEDEDNDFELYGGIAAFSLFGQSMPIALFCRRFSLPLRQLTNLLRGWRVSSSSGSVGPVIYEPSSVFEERRGNWGALKPKHDVVAELFFRFREDDNDFEDSDFDRLLSEYLSIMSEPEIEVLFRGMSDRDTMKQLKRRNIVNVHYRELVKLVYERIQEGGLKLSEQGRIDLCLILLWSNDGERMTEWNAEVHEMLKNTAPKPDGSHTASILYTEWGKWLARNRRDDEAEMRFRRVIRSYPDDTSSRMELGKLLVRQGEYDEAEAFFRKVIHLDAKNIYSRAELGRLLARQGRDDEAEKLFREVIRLSPTNISCRTELGKLLARQGRDDDAEIVFREAMDMNLKDIPSRTELGKLLARQGRDDEAEKLFREALLLSPTDISCRTELGILLTCKGKDGEAEAAFRQVIQLDPMNIRCRTELGKLLERTGRNWEAKTLYQEILDMNPSQREALNGLSRLRDVTP